MIILRADIVEEQLKGHQASRCILEATAAAADLLTQAKLVSQFSSLKCEQLPRSRQIARRLST